jgi:hypothetical protein
MEHLITHKTKAVFTALWLFVSLSLSSTAQTISINNSFSTDTEIYPFGTSDTIYGLTISGSCMLNSDTSLVRVILQNSNNEELLIFEAYPLITDGYDSSFSNIGDETRILEMTIPLSVRVEIVDANIDILELIEKRGLTENTDSLRLLLMKELELKKIGNLNREIAKRDMKWIANKNDITGMSYSEKKKLFGEKYNFNGFDYYAGGIFDFSFGNLFSPTSSALVPDFDWRNRHSANIELAPGFPYYGGNLGWMTEVDHQKCNHCWIFAPVHTTEALVNLYYNEQINLDLSEQAIASCQTPNDDCDGGNITSSFFYMKQTGIVDENCYPYAEDPAGNQNPCPAPFTNLSEEIKIDNYVNKYEIPSIDEIKAKIITKGPIVMKVDGWWHYLTFVGFGEVRRFDVLYNNTGSQHDTVHVSNNDALIGQNYWIVKNSWGESWGENGFGKIYLPLAEFNQSCHIETPIYSLAVSRSIACRDYDKDGYFNWGISEQKPTTCPECTDEKDSDDSNPRLGPFDENYFSVPVAPVMVVKQGSYTIHQNGFYSFYNEAWPAGHEEVLTFTITNTGTAQLNLMPNSFGGTVTLSDNNQSDFSVESVLLNPTIPMDGGSTSFDIRFKLNAPITETKIITVTIHLDEEDLEDFLFTLVFTECTDNIETEHIQVSTTWDGTMIKLGDVIVETGAVLSITGNVAFSQLANLFIEQGGTVIIDGGHLTSLCNSKWKGVDVWGDITKSQFNSPPEVRQEQGIIKIINGGKISFAENAIETIRYVDDKPDLATSGGIVSIKDGSIENCTNGVVFYPYENFYPDKSYPQPNWSSFYKAHFVNDLVYPEAQIYFYGVAGIMIQGSDFENKLPVSTFQNTTRAISSFNSGFSVSQIELPPYSGGDFIQSTFKGFDQGIYALSGRLAEYLSICSSVFEDNKRSIYLSSIETSVITQNEFMVRDNYSKYDEDTPLVGLYLDNQTSNFTIEENRFYSDLPYASLKTKECLGIVVNNSGQQPNELYNNNFSNLTIGIEAIGENRDAEGAGLCIKCNDFSSCVTDIYVAPDENPSNYQGIANYQGEPGYGDLTKPAGNIFSKNNTEANFTNDPDCGFIQYTHHISFSGGPKVKPDHSSNITVIQDPIATYDKQTACPSHLGGSLDLLAEKSVLSTESLLTEAYSDTLLMSIDGGNTTQLNLDVVTSTPDETMALRQQLLNESPYLSDTVMKSAIAKEIVLPNAIIRDVLMANPQAAKSVTVLQTLNARNNQMPDYMMAEIMQGRNVLGGKEVIEQKVVQHKTNYTRVLHKIEGYYQSDTLNMAASRDSLVELWSNQPQPESKYKLAFQYLSMNDSTGLFNTLNNIPVGLELTPQEETIYDLYTDIFDLLWQIQNDSIGLDSTRVTLLFNMAENYKTAPGALAMNILINKGEVIYNEPVYFPDYFKAITADDAGLTPSDKERLLKIFPNPAGDYCIIEYDLSQCYGEENIAITDLYGRNLLSFNPENKHAQKIISLAGFSAGVYFVSLAENGIRKESVKLIVVK